MPRRHGHCQFWDDLPVEKFLKSAVFSVEKISLMFLNITFNFLYEP